MLSPAFLYCLCCSQSLVVQFKFAIDSHNLFGSDEAAVKVTAAMVVADCNSTRTTVPLQSRMISR